MNKPNTSDSSKKQYPIYFYFILAAIPILFFVLLEMGLRLFSYGQEIPQWITYPYNNNDQIILNKNIAQRYFQSGKLVPNPWSDPFDRIKKPNTFRVFILGESSAAGYPYDLKSAFSGELKRRLIIAFPNKKIEVINFGISAINTYTIYDLLDGFIEQHPDLFIIYTGHNEYYGALGVGSSESVGNQRWLIRLTMNLEKYRTVQLLRQTLTSILSVGSTQSDSRKTLMESMVKEQYIPLNSDLYTRGVNQFSENMDLILSKIKDSGIPIIVSNLTSNLRDQKPFISEPFEAFPAANTVFLKAIQSEKDGKFAAAYSEYLLAKELDMLRFRAPNKFNRIIQDLAINYDIPFIDMDSTFRANSSNGIPGNNLFIDHLHPNMQGYRLMGKIFFETVITHHLTPNSDNLNYSFAEMDQLANQAYPITPLDTMAAYISITRLKAGWPFTDTKNKMKDPFENYKPENLTDSLALKISNSQMNIEDAHYTLALRAKSEKNTVLFLQEMKAVISVLPDHTDNYELVSIYLINNNQIELAIPYLEKLQNLKESEFSNKWLGIAHLINRDYVSAIALMERALSFSPKDTQLLFNLTGAYLYTHQNKKALETINQCLEINPNFPGGKTLQANIMKAIKK